MSQQYTNCNGCEHCSSSYGFGSKLLKETRAFVICDLFGRVYMDKHWDQQGDQPKSFFPSGCPRTQQELGL